VKAPRALDELPFAADLQPFGRVGGSQAVDLAARLEPEGDYDRVLFTGPAFVDAAAGGARFIECAFTAGAGFDGGRLRRARLSDVWFGETRLVGTDLAGISLTDAWFSGCVLAGVQAFSCVARRVRLRGCKLDAVNFRDSKLTDVVFEDCVLRDVDFGSAQLLRVTFAGSQLTSVDFTKISARDVDLRGARLGSEDTPGIKAGYDSLDGTVIDLRQLMTLAPLLAAHLGIRVAG
jgi:uncharacterized protein YjbI with pentapeptide repeats